MSKRIRKHHVITILQQCNAVSQYETGSERPLYLIGTLKKRYNPATECKMWTVGRGLGMSPRVLGKTLKEAHRRLVS